MPSYTVKKLCLFGSMLDPAASYTLAASPRGICLQQLCFTSLFSFLSLTSSPRTGLSSHSSSSPLLSPPFCLIPSPITPPSPHHPFALRLISVLSSSRRLSSALSVIPRTKTHHRQLAPMSLQQRPAEMRKVCLGCMMR